jgi:hypothetical protein
MNEHMRKRRLPVGIITIIPLIVGFGAYAFVAPTPTPTPAGAPTVTASATAGIPWPAAPTVTSPIAASTPASPPNGDAASPTPYPGAPVYARTHGPFHDGAWVRVNVGAGDCLNARIAPTLDPAADLVNICLPDGAEGYLAAPAQERDGHWWWLLVGAGYVADDYLTYVRDASLRGALAPQLAGLGSIAFLRDPGEVWLMQSDGSGQRRLYAAGDGQPSTYITDLSWSPDATRLSFNVPHYGGGDGGTMELVIIDTQGVVLADIRGVAGRGWSPDGTRVGIVKGAQPQQMGGGWKGVPGWADVATGESHLVGDAAYFQQDPPAFNFDGTLLLVTQAADDGSSRGIVIMDAAGKEHARLEPPKDVYYGSPLWAPESNRIGFYVSEQKAPHYAVYDLAAGAIVARAGVPQRNPDIGGKCGGGDMWRSAWSRDGSSVLYSYTEGLAGTNGVWVWNVAAGKQRLVPAFGAGAPSDGPGGRVVFSSGLFVMAGDTGGALTVLITDGRSPIWSPR